MLTERVVREYLAPALDTSGFVRQARSCTWHRDTPELRHIITFSKRADHLLAQWGVSSAELIADLWEEVPATAAEQVTYSFMTGWVEKIPGTQARVPPRLTSEPELTLLSEDLWVAGDWLAQFARRRDARSYLLANREPTDRRGFTVPANWRLKLATCAFLSALDGDAATNALALEALAAWEGYPDGHRQRRMRDIAGK